MQRLEKAMFLGTDYENNRTVEVDLMKTEDGEAYVPRMGEYFVHNNIMYKITHVYWNRDKATVFVKGHKIVLCYVLTPYQEPVFEGRLEEVRAWLIKRQNETGRIYGSVYIEAPYNEAISIDRFVEND